MNECTEQEHQACREEFAAIHRKLDHLDEAIRGNGKPGLQLRLDRLEIAQRRRSRLFWMILGACVTLSVPYLWQRMVGG